MANINASTPQLKVVKKWIEAMSSLDSSNVAPLVSKDFKYQSFPKTTDLPDVHEQAKEVHMEWISGIMPMTAKFEVIVHEVIEAPGKVVIHATGVASLVDGTRHEYDTLSIFSLVEEDGEIKILEGKDFSDPEKRSAFYAGVAKAAGQKTPAS